MIAALLLFAAMGLQETDPLAPAARGEWQCYTPDVARKTCRAMAGYERQADGSWLNTARVLVDPSGIVLESVTTGHVVDGAFCGRIERADLLTGKVFINGERLSDADAAPILSLIARGYESLGMMGAMICTRYVPDGEMLKAVITRDGGHRPEWEDSVIWVRPDQGFRVASQSP